MFVEQRVHDPMSEIEAFRQQLIEANPRCASSSIDPITSYERRDLIHVDLDVAHQALDRLTDNLLKEMRQAYSNEALSYYAELRGELCAYFNGLSLLLDDYHDGIELYE
ncbi:MAG: hypothetical protein GWP23_09180 [Synechococcales cyanobacterium H12SWP_bin.12]|nr:hypothetical protein [Synechococcales cyanobacterium H12SWP_bin.12]